MSCQSSTVSNCQYRDAVAPGDCSLSGPINGTRTRRYRVSVLTVLPQRCALQHLQKERHLCQNVSDGDAEVDVACRCVIDRKAEPQHDDEHGRKYKHRRD